MSADRPVERQGSTRRFWRLAALVFLVQTALIFALAERKPRNPPTEPDGTAFRLVLRQDPARTLLEPVLASDPTLFILPHESGFSGRAWLLEETPDYQPPEWHEPPQWLAMNRSVLGGEFIKSIDNGGSNPAVGADKISPLAGFQPPPSPSTARGDQSSAFRLDGPLRKRLLPQAITLPDWEHTEPIPPTVVELAANGAGQVVLCRLAPPRPGDNSGLPAANQRALEVCRRLRFQPINDGPARDGLTWGKAVFVWKTTAAQQVSAQSGPTTGADR